MIGPISRFMAKVKVTDAGCWIWTGSRKHGGLPYGHFRMGGHIMPAHRAAWILFNGKIPRGRSVLHRCDVPPCIRPQHLFLGTHVDNMRDMVAKGRSYSPTRKKELTKAA